MAPTFQYLERLSNRTYDGNFFVWKYNYFNTKKCEKSVFHGIIDLLFHHIFGLHY